MVDLTQVQMVPDLRWFDLGLFYFTMVLKCYTLVETVLQMLNFRLFLGYRYSVRYSLEIVSGRQQAASALWINHHYATVQSLCWTILPDCGLM